jgi:uncharacterized membrane protein YphA (DoxX/SURF4 family)
MTTDGLGYAAALLLAAIFVLAGASKLRDRDATVRSFRQLGVPGPDSAARLVPLPELAAAVLLVVVPAVGAIVALVLLALFTTFVVNRLRAGVDAPCACFGSTGGAPLSWLTLGRNALLAILAVMSLVTMQPVRPTWIDVLVVWGAAVLATVAMGVVARRRAPTSLTG